MISSLTPLAAFLAPASATRLSAPDLAIVALYLISITIFGLRFSRKNKLPGAKSGSSLKSYFLADNTIPWWAIALSIVSAETSTLTIVSIPGVAFGGDFGFLQIVLGYMIGRIVVAVLFLPKYFRGEMLTAYQLIDQRFGHTLHKVTAALFLVTRAAAEGVRVFAISIVVGVAIGTGDTLSIFIISALTLLYTFEGGMAAVIWTDVVQMALYVAGTLVALFTLGQHVPGGWTQIHAVAEPLGKFHMLNFAFNLTQSYTFWAGILGGTFLTMASHGTDQLMVQRMLAARDLRESRLALLSSGLVIFLQFTLFLLIGIGLFVFYGGGRLSGAPSIAHSAMGGITGLSPDRIFPTFIVNQMPHGIAGLLVAAILAAAMSNLSAALNSLSSTTVVDFYVPWRNRRQFTEASNTTLVSRIATIFWAIILFLIAVYSIQVGGKGHVVETGLSIASVAYGCLLGVFLLGTLTRYATQSGAITGMICGFALNLTLWLPTITPIRHLGPILIPKVAFTWYVLLGALATFLIGSLASYILPKPRPRSLTPAVSTLLCLCLCLCPFGLSFRSEAEESAVALSSSAPFAARPSSPLRSAVAVASPQPTPDFSEVSTLITQAIAAHKLPGAVVLIGHNNQIVFQKAYGLRNLAGQPAGVVGVQGDSSIIPLDQTAEPMTLDTIFDMASLTKVLVTTTAILQLYEQHNLDLDTPVSHYLPAFVSTTGLNPPSAVIPAEGRNLRSSPSPDPALKQASTWKSQITIRQLLTHYSGLPEDVDLKDPWGLAAPDKSEGIRRALASVPYGPPGLTFKYSDINFITLGALVEKLTGEPLDDYAKNNIFFPLHMMETSFPISSCTCSHPKPPAYGHSDPFFDLYVSNHGAIACARNICTFPPADFLGRTAPTAHDNEGTPATNPDFDHLLRGTVHDPTTRRMGGVAGHAGVFSTAQDAAKFSQALLDKLLKNTGPFPLQQSTLRLATIPNEPVTAVQTATIFTQDGQTTKGEAARGLGWDLNSAFSRPRGEIFPLTDRSQRGSFGHTGFTGTSIWLDPASNTYVILLANAIHPRVAASISPLRGQVATAAAKALGICAPDKFCDSGTYVCPKGAICDNVIVTASDGRVDEGERSEVHTLVESQSGAPSSTDGPTVGQHGVSSEARPPSSNPTQNASHPEVTLGSSNGQSKDPESAGPAQTARTTPPQSPTLTGIDILEQTHFASLKSLPHHGPTLKIALLTNQSGLDSHGNRTIDILAHASPQLELTKIFSPEHGLYGKQDAEHLTAETDPTTHLPVISLYGPKPSDKRPKPVDLHDVDAVVIDLQDAGVRFWTYETIVGYFLEAAATAHIEIIVLDRPNPIAAVAPQGPTSDPGFESTYTDFLPIPLRHSLTLGELARYFNANLPPSDGGASANPAALTVVSMQNYSRQQFYADTGLPWTPPSPNLRTPQAAILYPALGLTEQTNVSVGRGTEAPFENLGAPYIVATELAAYLTDRHIPGLAITATTITIAEDANHYPFHGQTIPAIHFEVTARATLNSPELGIELLSALHRLYPTQFQLAKAKTLLANAATLDALTAGQDPRTIAATWNSSLAHFSRLVQPYLLYP